MNRLHAFRPFYAEPPPPQLPAMSYCCETFPCNNANTFPGVPNEFILRSDNSRDRVRLDHSTSGARNLNFCDRPFATLEHLPVIAFYPFRTSGNPQRFRKCQRRNDPPSHLRRGFFIFQKNELIRHSSRAHLSTTSPRRREGI